MHILFVCTGNICRSPSAERLAAAIGNENAIPEFRASSAGTRAVIGHPVHPDAARVLEGLGGDAAGFAARQLTANIANDADLVIAMTKAHRDAVLELAPRQLHRTFTLTEAAQLVTEFDPADVKELATLRSRLRAEQSPDVPDPIGQDQEFFDQVGSQIAELVRPIIEFCRDVSSP
ncbi:low molecular weight phosphatase family protein [Mycolicibacterium sp.]|uniref:arsenate reductase/protein-tyrosine-phosphatase family protein n=1 Tax=Mycolicibacterium sp. TaxID=2320850 RepID=UPI0025D1ECB5|nr:low molecular weight phosphatase family protein [Mycolicibacterium sp.]MCB9409830.1 low molecular weight phosphatase family protein [Mycolicibacterium sp.]